MAKLGEKPAPPKPAAKNNLMVLGVVALVALAAGAFAPSFLGKKDGKHDKDHAAEAKKKGDDRIIISFGEKVVNLRTPNHSRLLKIKILLVVDKAEEKAFKEVLDKKKPFLNNAVISYLADRSLDEIKGTAGINRVRRELLDQFNSLLYPDGEEKIRDLLFEDFVSQ